MYDNCKAETLPPLLAANQVHYHLRNYSNVRVRYTNSYAVKETIQSDPNDDSFFFFSPPDITIRFYCFSHLNKNKYTNTLLPDTKMVQRMRRETNCFSPLPSHLHKNKD